MRTPTTLILFAAGSVLFAVAPLSATTLPFTECPAVGADTSCGLLITINSNGSLSFAADPSQGPFEGADDTLVGVLNNSSTAVASIKLHGVDSSGMPAFMFDGDGLCSIGLSPEPAGCTPLTPFGPTGYEGPVVSFTDISLDNATGTVTFAGGLAPGGTAYFSLQGNVTPSTLSEVTPEPGSLLLLASGLLGVGLQIKRRLTA